MVDEIKDSSFCQHLLHKEWYLLRTVLYEVWSILRMERSQRKKDFCRSEHTTVAVMQLRDMLSGCPLCFATCTVRHRWLVLFHVI